jgi:hypothetical protein
VLRTLFASLVFLGILLARSPQRVFLSLNARGDWMLDGCAEPWAADARRWVLRAAAGSHWLYKLTDDNPLHRAGRTPPPRPVETRTSITADRSPSNHDAPREQPRPPQPVEPARDPHAWPFAEELHVAVRELPARTASIAAVLNWYRVRWQIELYFKRCKSLLQLHPVLSADDDMMDLQCAVAGDQPLAQKRRRNRVIWRATRERPRKRHRAHSDATMRRMHDALRSASQNWC